MNDTRNNFKQFKEFIYFSVEFSFDLQILPVGGIQVDGHFILRAVQKYAEAQAQGLAWFDDHFARLAEIECLMSERIGRHKSIVAHVPSAGAEIIRIGHDHNTGEDVADQTGIIAP